MKNFAASVALAIALAVPANMPAFAQSQSQVIVIEVKDVKMKVLAGNSPDELEKAFQEWKTKNGSVKLINTQYMHSSGGRAISGTFSVMIFYKD